MEFLLSQRRRLNGWELPLAGLLLIAGAATAVATLQTAAPQKQAKVVDSTSNAPNFETAAPQLPSPALDSTSLASNLARVEPQKAVASEKHAPVVDSTAVASTLEATAPQQPVQTVDSTAVASNWEAPAPQQPAPAVDSPAVPSNVPTAAPQKPATAVKSTAVASNLKAATPQKPAKATASSSVTMPSAKWNRQPQEVHKATIAQLPTSAASLPDGTYLYGQSSEPQQIGKEYLVFQVSQGKVRGAMYLPSSEYSCFYGTLDSKQMNLTVVNPYDQTAVSHAIARSQPSQIAAASGQINLQ